MLPRPLRLLLILVPAVLIPLNGCALFSPDTKERRPFFQKELEVESHGKKTMFDRLVELDPGQLEVDMASDYLQDPPAVVVLLPFTDRGSAQYVVDKIPLTFRNREKRNQWAWTDAQRLRKAFAGYLSEREFMVVNPIAVDAVLKSRGIDDAEKLETVSVLDLGKWFNCDAVMYGEVDHYEAFYFGMLSGYVVGVQSRMVSTHSGEILMRTRGARYNVNFLPAIDLQDILINSAEGLLQLRDVELARSEEEVARELVHRIPISQNLTSQMAKNAVQRANENEEIQEDHASMQKDLEALKQKQAPMVPANEVQPEKTRDNLHLEIQGNLQSSAGKPSASPE